jgi:hypothetical protein
MLTAIDFDYQTPLDAVKVSKLRTYPVLPAEF